MTHLVPFLPADAPFNTEQRAYLNGFFAGLGSHGGADLRGADLRGADLREEAARAMPSGDGQAAPAPVLAEPVAPAYGRSNPYPARLAVNRKLSGTRSDKDVRHMVIDIGDSGMEYAVGDALGVMPQNDPADVEELTTALELSADEVVHVGGDALPLNEALRDRLDVSQPPMPMLEAFAIEDEELRKRMEDRHALNEYLWGRDVLDLVLAAPSVRFDAQELVDLLRPLQHRLYSISSSPVLHPEQVHLTVATVRYEAHGRRRQGVCSTFLADRCPADAPLPVFVHPNRNFRLPSDGDRPVVMIGPGTGIAPFRAFLQERRAAGATGKSWLFFGDRHAESDFLYGEELLEFMEDGTLDRLDLAWSRDGTRKVYVQHRMLEQADGLYAWIEEGAALYVCGDASRMARDVDAALHRIVSSAGGLSEEAAAEYVKRLKSEKRYLRDVY